MFWFGKNGWRGWQGCGGCGWIGLIIENGALVVFIAENCAAEVWYEEL